MNIENFNFFDLNDEEFLQPEYPLFNFDALKKSEIQDDITFFDAPISFERPILFEDILQKRVKAVAEPLKKRGRKPAIKNAKDFDDPSITIEEIIRNDLAGTPMEAEKVMKKKQLQKMRETKSLKKAAKEKKTNAELKNDAINDNNIESTLVLEPLIETSLISQFPKIIIKDGKVTINEPAVEEKGLKMYINNNEKPYKLTSMSFRNKNHTPRWTPEETKKFYKAIELFGTDFSMVAKLFPQRSRTQIKNKFNKEEKANLFTVDATLKKHFSINKRPLMNKIRDLYRNLEDQSEVQSVLESPSTIQEGVALERTLSNISNGSIEMEKVMEEVQDIFLREMRQKQFNFPELDFKINPLMGESQIETMLYFNERNNGEELKAITINKEESNTKNKENLLSKFLM